VKRILPILFLLAACGQADALTPQPPGVYVDETYVTYLAAQFAEAQDCADLPAGAFADLSVVQMPPKFPCRWYVAGCSGEYLPPNTILLGSRVAWKHEVLHYLLYVNTGDADAGHASDLFGRCE